MAHITAAGAATVIDIGLMAARRTAARLMGEITCVVDDRRGFDLFDRVVGKAGALGLVGEHEVAGAALNFRTILGGPVFGSLVLEARSLATIGGEGLGVGRAIATSHIASGTFGSEVLGGGRR